MIQLNHPPFIEELRTFISRVPYYPLTARQLVLFARSIKAPTGIIDFYKAFPQDEIFTNRDDLWTRSEQIELMEQQDEPYETVLSHEG